MADEIHIPDQWQAAIEGIAGGGYERICVIGPTDSGKSSFVAALVAAQPRLAVIDADPGQKLVGPPGTVSVGRWYGGRVAPTGFVFIGSTSSSNIFLVSRACQRLAAAAPPFVANTSGLVQDFGVRLQSATISALDADLIVAVGGREAVAPILDKQADRPALILPASEQAVRKTPPVRLRLRQAAFDEAMAGAEALELRSPIFEPAPPIRIELGGRHPVCSLADAEGLDMAIGVVEASDGATVRIFAPPPPRPVRIVRLGKMWVEPDGEGGWTLLEVLHPCWVHDEPEG